MPRTARVRSASGIYHVMVRGVNRQDVFLSDDDAFFYLRLLRNLVGETDCTVYAYCLMSNHVHLLVKESEEGKVSELMHRLGTTSALWYNGRYQRVGHLFQGRCASEAVEDDRYFLAVLRYIHQNPVKAGLSQMCAGYLLSSYRAYALGHDPFLIAKVDFATGIMGDAERLLSFMNETNDDALDPQGIKDRASDEELRSILTKLCGDRNREALNEMRKADRNAILRELKARGSFSLAQIARVTGIPKATVGRA